MKRFMQIHRNHRSTAVKPQPKASQPKLFSFLFVAMGIVATAVGQTNAPVKELSLQDAIQLTLQHNLELKIDRYNPLIALYRLRGDYGGYDPTLSASGQHDFNESGSRLLSGGFSIPGSTSDDNSFSAGLSGLLPSGAKYNVSGNAKDTYGHSFSLNTNNDLVSNPFENSAGAVSINATQPLLRNFWIDSTRLAIRLDKNNLKSSELDLRLAVMDTVTTLEKAYYLLIYRREYVAVQEKALEFAQRTAAENTKRVQVGAMAPLEEKQAQAQAASSEADLIQARSDLAVQEHVIKQLVADNYSDWANVTIEPSASLTAPYELLNLQDSWRRALDDHPTMLKAKLALENAGIQVKYTRNQLFPELDAFGTLGYNGSGREFSTALDDVHEMDRPFYTFGGSISIPLANTVARNAHKASRATLEQTVLDLKRTERDIMKNIEDDIRQAQASYERVGATRKAREYAEDALAAEQKKLENGKSTTYTVLQMQRDLTTARGNEIQALATYNQYLAQLSFDEGTTLDRLKIDINLK